MKRTPNLIVEMEALHDEITGNFVLYSEEALSQIDTWLKPYAKPVIMHHKDEDGKIVGRIIDALKIRSTINPKLSALWFKTRITDEETKQGIKDGTYLTTSVGVSGTDVECSICGHKISSGTSCQHKRGKRYKNQLCYWIVKRFIGKEVSLVIVPSDQYSRITRFYEEQEQEPEKSKGDEKEMELQEALEKIKELEVTIETQKKSIESSETVLQESQELKTKLADIEKALENETLLREGLETELNNIRLVEKENMINDIVALRESLKMHKIETDVLSTKSDIYLQEALDDLKAELAFKESLEKDESDKEDSFKKLKEKQLSNNQVVLDKALPKQEVKANDILKSLL